MNYDIKKLLKCNGIELCAALLLCFVNTEAKQSISGALQSELSRAASAPASTAMQPSIGARNIQIESAGDEYVQSEAHLQVPAVKEKMAKFIQRVPGDPNQPEIPLTPNQMIVPYLNIIAAALNKEVELKNTHYVLYNASNNEWRVPQDMYKKLYIKYNKIASSLDDFVFVRFTNAPSINAQDFLKESIAEWGGVNDNIQEVRNVMMSMNLDIFGGVGTPGECTWNFFTEAKSHRWPFPTNYYDVLKSFDITYNIETLAKEAQELSKMLVDASPEQTLMQFCIPQNKIDDVAYVAWILGFPAHAKSMELVEALLEDKPRVGSITGPAVKKVMKRFKKEDNNPVYKELIDAAANGEFGISGFMETMRNNPFKIKDLNEIQARLFVTNDIFKNPSSGVKVYTYITTPKNIQDDYKRRLDALVAKIISQEQAKTPAQKDADRQKNGEIFKRIKEAEAVQAAADKAKKAAEKKATKEAAKALAGK